MKTLLNIIWIFTGGIGMTLSWLIAGVVCACTIIGIPFAGACFDIAGHTFMPFGKIVVERQHLNTEAKPRPIMSFLWLPLGICLFLGYIISALGLMFTIIGIPLGAQVLKIAQVSLNPYKYTLVDAKIVAKK